MGFVKKRIPWNLSLHVSKHLERYVTELAGRHNVKDLDTLEQMAVLVRGMVGKKLPYKELIKEVSE